MDNEELNRETVEIEKNITEHAEDVQMARGQNQAVVGLIAGIFSIIGEIYFIIFTSQPTNNINRIGKDIGGFTILLAVIGAIILMTAFSATSSIMFSIDKKKGLKDTKKYKIIRVILATEYLISIMIIVAYFLSCYIK